MEINFKDEKSKNLFNQNKKGTKSKKTSNQNQGYKVKDSFDISKTQVPKDTREALSGFNSKEFDNFYLKLNQFARFDIADNKKQDEKKFIFYRNKAKDLEDIEIKVNFGDFDFKNNLTKQEQIIKTLFGEKNYHKEELTTSSRLLIGSEESIYETSIRLHHIYGIPYIPASAIKGIVRSYIILEYFADELEKYKDNYNKFEDEVLFQCDWFVDIFGSQESEGKVIFVDAFPTNKPTIKVDIMNPHYGDYYSKGKAPTDTMKLNPINFLTVENTTFEFFIASKESLEAFKIKEKTLIEWFQEALQNHGIGAKTAVGYGYFEEQ